MNFSESLKKQRESRGYTGKDFSELLGISYPTYMSYENKGREPKFDLLIKMSVVLGCTVDELMGIPEKKIVERKWNETKDTFEMHGFQITESENEPDVVTLLVYFPIREESGEIPYIEKDFPKQYLIEAIETFEEYCIETLQGEFRNFFYSNFLALDLFFELSTKTKKISLQELNEKMNRTPKHFQNYYKERTSKRGSTISKDPSSKTE